MQKQVTEAPREQAPSKGAGKLSVVGTPIGNLEDLTLRALRVLKEVDLIAAEDTRHTRKLLSHYAIHTPLISYHEHNKRSRTPLLISKLKGGARIALVSDAGMPGISDPGHQLIVAAIENEIEVAVVPGPSALISALVISGLPTDDFTFVGFPPRKPKERKRFIDGLLAENRTTVLFESPLRLIGLLELVAIAAPQRKLAVARELTKKFEQVLRGTAGELIEHFQAHEPRGELVVLIAGLPAAPEQKLTCACSATELVEQLMSEKGLPKKEAMREAARRLGVSRREVYEALLKEKSN